jgi:isopentenyl-diphosphate delta-isomerase
MRKEGYHAVGKEVGLMPMTSTQSEMLILVDENDEVIGFQEKESCHDGDGLLHRAFSVFLFDQTGRLLLQKRSHHKRLWGDFWSNSCCSHPRPHEDTREAAEKRVREELGVDSCLRFLFKFEYRARYDGRGSENELCHVYAGLLAGEPKVNEFEVSAWRMICPQSLDRELVEKPGAFTPWLKSEWPRLRRSHWGSMEGILALGNG